MRGALYPVGSNELFGGALDVTIHRSSSSALDSDSTSLPFAGAAAEHLFEADSGEQALEITRETSIDLVVMDYRMNRLNSLDAAKNLRGILGYEHVPVILVTSENFPGDCEQTPAPYVDGYIRHYPE